MKKIFGVGIPQKIKPAGTEYIDTRTGIRYNQNFFPSGNSWTRMDDSSPSSSSSDGFSGVLYYITKELNQTDILSSYATPVLIGNIPTDDNGAVLIQSVSLIYSGTSINSNLSSAVGLVNSQDEIIAYFIPYMVFNSTSPLDMKTGSLSGKIKQNLNSGGINLYLKCFSQPPTGGDNTSYAKIFITYLVP